MEKLTFRWEPLNYLLATGLPDLTTLHWDEAGCDKDIFEHDPDWARYGRMENANILRWLAVRQNDELIGYSSVIINDNIHDKKVCCALISDIFVLPEKRQYGTANKLMDFLEGQLVGIGVKHITVGARLMVGEVGKWLKRRGYHCDEHLYTKSLGARRIH